MRLNQFIAQATGLSRRQADNAIADKRVSINEQLATLGQPVEPQDTVFLDGKVITLRVKHTTIMLNKPVGYVCSRNGQGSKTVYDLLPDEYHRLKLIGRLDKDSSGLLLLTDDGQLSNELTHPRYAKTKTYEVELDRPLDSLHRQRITEQGIALPDGPSRLGLARLNDGNDTAWRVMMREGRNRQIRRTFAALGYTVTKLHRTEFGNYKLGNLTHGQYNSVNQ